jgi:hypothetical protein
MMKHILFALSLILLSYFGNAHPGVGIVKDSRGNIFYTDLKQVWRIGPDGSRSIAVPGIHTHELYLDPQDNLYGEHLWFNGEQINTWGSFVWRLRPDGKMDTVVASHEGFNEVFSFNRDLAGNQYQVERATISRIIKKDPHGNVQILAEGRFSDIRWLHVTPAGVVYFIDLLDLYRIDTEGKLVCLAKGLAHKPGNLSLHSARHSIFGLWKDERGHLFAAVYSERTVKKVGADGSISNVAYSLIPWGPVGGVFDREGNLWLMESSLTNEVRVRKINAGQLEGKQSKIIPLLNTLVPLGISITMLTLCGLGVKKLMKKRKVADS